MKKRLFTSIFLIACTFGMLKAEDAASNATGFYLATANDSKFCPPFELGWSTLPSVDYDQYESDGFMDLDMAKSIMMNITFFGHDIVANPSKTVALSAFMRFNVNNFVFNSHIRLREDDSERVIAEPADVKYDKSKLTTMYLDLPIAASFRLAGKPYGMSVMLAPGIKLNGHSKVKSPKEKEIIHAVRDFRLAVEGRLQVLPGFYVFGMYDLLPMFKDDKGPDTHALSVGLGLGIPIPEI